MMPQAFNDARSI